MNRRLLVQGATAAYHVVSRSAYQMHSLGKVEKSVFRKLLRKQAQFCGVEILTYCLLENHFHLLVRVPNKTEITDEELLKRYDALYGYVDHQWVMSTADLELLLKKNDSRANRVRNRLIARMGNLSIFVKELKQRFGIWYNRTHGNQGTLWSRRFDSYIVENVNSVLKLMAGYIDMNPIRLKLCKRPEDYPFSGFGEASAGGEAARAAICGFFSGEKNWAEISRRYGEMVEDKEGQLKSVFMPLKHLGRGVIGERNFTAQWFDDHQSSLSRKPSVGYYALCGLLYVTACVLEANTLVRRIGPLGA